MMPGRRRRFHLLAILIALVIAVSGAVVAVVESQQGGGIGTPNSYVRRGPELGRDLRSPLGGTGSKRPNIVFVLTDDLSTDLIRYMPHVQALRQAGMSFSNYTVDDSLCCPSRASIFTGRFPHNTGVFTNNSVDGGFHVFHRRGNERQTFATTLQRAGYRTALLGKYLNGYRVDTHLGDEKTYVPPGWDRWAVSGWGYQEFGYRLNDDHRLRRYGLFPDDYLTTVLQHFGQDFITSTARQRQPFFLELATFSPHKPYTPAYADAKSFPGVRAPRGPAFGVRPAHAPPWLDKARPLGPRRIAGIDRDYRKRVQAVQSVDRTVDALQHTLGATGQLANTVFIFSSDNGYHMGQYGLGPGKLTAFDTDVTVPLIIAGPGIAPGTVSNKMVQNIDLAPTFHDIAGAPIPQAIDGRSIVGLLKQTPGIRWRHAALIEHHGFDVAPNDPDRQSPGAGNPPSYEAIRTASFTYVRYHDGEREYYDRVRDPHELNNIAYTLSQQRMRALNKWVDALHTCRGAVQCSAAGRVGAQ